MKQELSREARIRQQQLQRKYIDSLPAKRSRIEEGWKQVQSSSWSDAAVAALKADVHRLAGSAGSYGLQELGDVAARLESTLRSDEGTLGWRKLVFRQVNELIQMLGGEMRGGPPITT